MNRSIVPLPSAPPTSSPPALMGGSVADPPLAAGVVEPSVPLLETSVESDPVAGAGVCVVVGCGATSVLASLPQPATNTALTTIAAMLRRQACSGRDL